MDKIQGSRNVSKLNELEQVFQEYKRKLEDAEEEANEIVDAAWGKAEQLIADKQKEASRIADDANRKAKQEADRIICEANNRAAGIEREAADKAKKEAKERTRKEIESIIANIRKMAEKEAAEIVARAQKEADGIIKNGQESARLQIFKEAETIVAEAKNRAKKVDEDSFARTEEIGRLIISTSQRAYEIMSRVTGQMQTELNDLVTMFNKKTGDLEIKSIMEETEISTNANKTSDNSKSKGWCELNIVPPYDERQIQRLVDSLKQIPSVKLGGRSGNEENLSIYLDIAEPIPLQNIMEEMSIVESYDARGDKIQIHLKHIND